jgi:glycosyltransferase involved in cell wall biosynthesis
MSKMQKDAASPMYDVCAAVISDLTFDARVWKEARSLANAGYRVRLIGCKYELPHAQTRRHGDIDVFEVPLGTRAGGISLLRRARALLQVWGAILRTPARAYHAHNIHVAPAAWAASECRRSTLIYDAHELYGDMVGSGITARVANAVSAAAERFILRHSDMAITTNPSRARILEQRSGRANVDVVANVPQLTEEVEPLDPGFPTGRSTLLYQGGVYAHARSFKEMVSALPLLDEFDLVILGPGRDEEFALVRRWARDAGVEQRVHFLPPRPFDDLVRTAASATVGIVPIKPVNLGSYTGDTNKLFEYLMAGLPVVASDLPEIRRALANGNPPVGELFDPFSPESIADAVRRIVADRDLYEARRREARRLAVERFNWRVEEQVLLRFYDASLRASERA